MSKIETDSTVKTTLSTYDDDGGLLLEIIIDHKDDDDTYELNIEDCCTGQWVNESVISAIQDTLKKAIKCKKDGVK